MGKVHQQSPIVCETFIMIQLLNDIKCHKG